VHLGISHRTQGLDFFVLVAGVSGGFALSESALVTGADGYTYRYFGDGTRPRKTQPH
jgi:hypothetical protein